MTFQDRYRALEFVDAHQVDNYPLGFPLKVMETRRRLGYRQDENRASLVLRLHRELPTLIHLTEPKSTLFNPFLYLFTFYILTFTILTHPSKQTKAIILLWLNHIRAL